MTEPANDEATQRGVRRTVMGAMAGGVIVMGSVVVWLARISVRTPTPEALRQVNFLTAAAMALTFSGVMISEYLWRAQSKAAAGDPAKLTAAFVTRCALREGPALLGLAAAMIAATGGVLRAYPAYWADFAPGALFLSFAAAHWPSDASA